MARRRPVSGLRKSRSEARESQHARPVGDAVVQATLPYLPEVVSDREADTSTGRGIDMVVARQMICGAGFTS
jgi:hypothetical protein